MNQTEIESLLDYLEKDHSIDFMLFILAKRDPNFVNRIITALVKQKDFQIDQLQTEKTNLAYSFSLYINNKLHKYNVQNGRQIWNGLKELLKFFHGAGVQNTISDLMKEIKEKETDLE